MKAANQRNNLIRRHLNFTKPCFRVIKSSNNFLKPYFKKLLQGFIKSLRCNTFLRFCFVRLKQNLNESNLRLNKLRPIKGMIFPSFSQAEILFKIDKIFVLQNHSVFGGWLKEVSFLANAILIFSSCVIS